MTTINIFLLLVALIIGSFLIFIINKKCLESNLEKRKKICAEGTKAEGIITKRVLISPKTMTINLHYTFATDDNKSVESFEQLGWKAWLYKIGSKVDVYYLSKNPLQNTIIFEKE